MDPGPPGARKGAEALGHLEEVVVKAGGAVLRYGSLYGPGAIDDWVKLVRERQFPLVGGGPGYLSWVHLDDAASATVLALERQGRAAGAGQPVCRLAGSSAWCVTSGSSSGIR